MQRKLLWIKFDYNSTQYLFIAWLHFLFISSILAKILKDQRSITTSLIKCLKDQRSITTSLIKCLKDQRSITTSLIKCLNFKFL